MNNSKVYSFLAIQYFIFLFAFVFLPKRIFQMVFLGELGLFSFIAIKNLSQIKTIISWRHYSTAISFVFATFLLVGLIYLVLSYNGLADFWSIDNLYFEKSYIPRHFFVVAELVMPVGLAFALYRSSLIYTIKNSTLLFLFIIAFCLRFLGYNPLHSCFFCVSTISLYAFRKEKYHLLILVILALISHSAYVLASLLLWIVCLGRKWLLKNLRLHLHFKFYLFAIFLGILVFFFLNNFLSFLAHDENALWRWNVWVNEVISLMKTMLMGVGFGTAYVTSDIIFEVNNYNMYLDLDDMSTVYDRLFLVANHNSFLNMFYRMGLLGGVLFIGLNLMLVRWTLYAYRESHALNQPYIWCAFACFVYQTFIILLNPGLEMMQFAMQYLPTLAILLAVLFANQEDCINEDCRNHLEKE